MSLRRALFPLDHVTAEMAAVPIASRRALELGLVALDPGLDGATGDLWRYAEAKLLRALRSISVEELTHHRDHVWFSCRPWEAYPVARQRPTGRTPRVRRDAPMALSRYLTELSLESLRVEGRVAHPHPEASAHSELGAVRGRRAWRWMTFSLPSDVLLAAHPEQPDRVETLSRPLARLLEDKGFAESHAHLGACMSFDMLWAALMQNLARCGPTDFASPDAQFDEGLDFGPWLLRAAIARLVLGAWLNGGRGKSRSRFFAEDERMRSALAAGGPTIFARVEQALEDLEQGRSSRVGRSDPGGRDARDRDFAGLQVVYQRLLGADLSTLSRFSSRDEVLDGDPLARGCQPPRGELSANLRFLRASFDVLRSPGRDAGGWISSDRFERLFWQVLRVECLFYRHVVQRPLTPGLQWFVRFYDRMRAGRAGLGEACLLDSALRLAGEQQGLRALEVRVAPWNGVSDNAHMLDALASAAEGRAPEVGVVVHFIRFRGGNWGRGRPAAHGRDTGGQPKGGVWRFARERRGFDGQAHALGSALRQKPERLRILRGFDVCTDEYGVPLWVVASAFRIARWEASNVACLLGEAEPDSILVPGATAHAGEDFIHLLGGLRRVHDSIVRLDLREGDRLGHALALGLDAEAWAKETGSVRMTTEERFFDLIWEGKRGAAGRHPTWPQRSGPVEDELLRLGQVLFGAPDLTMDAILKFEGDLYDPDALLAIGYPHRPPEAAPKPSTRQGRLIQFLSDPEVYARGQELVMVDTGSEGPALAGLQAGLREEVRRRGLAIEVNPTCNLLVGNYAQLGRHPIWRIAPVDGAEGITVVVGSDDPLIVATHLPREFQLLTDALIESGHSRTEAWRYIDGLRDAGMRARFSLKRP